jgi:histone H3/H4
LELAKASSKIHIYHEVLRTAEGLSVNRVGNISKSHTSLNVSQDFKECVKEIIEGDIRQMTIEMERKVKTEVPDSKSLLNLDSPQLSLHRVKGIMQQDTGLKVGTEAAINIKVFCERRIREITQKAESNAKDEGLSTIKKRHIPQSFGTVEDVADEEKKDMSVSEGIQEEFLIHDRLRSMLRQYSGMKIDPDAMEEIGYWMEDIIEQEILNIETSFKGKEAKALLESYNRISGLLSQLTIKKVLKNAEDLAHERKKRSITIVEISDAFNRTQL